MSEPDARKIFWQIICAVDYCHRKGIVHRDLKAENLLLSLEMNIKIADFGFGNFFKPGEELSTWCGSPPYAAPEVFEGHKYYGPEVDVWSLGVVLYVLVCGAFPFDGENLHALRDRVISGRFRIPYFMSSECESLLRKMLVVDPKRRISISQIMQHHWLVSNSRFQMKGEIDMYVSLCNREDLSLRFHDVAISDRKRPQLNEIYHEHILTTMENAGIDRQKTIEALEKDDYNNFHAIYNLLLDRLKQQQQQQYSRKMFSDFGRAFSDACPRRPSTIADQAVICPGHRAPVLADTKQGPFSQTTDCVQFHEVPNPVCQRQQMIYTDPCSGRPLLPSWVGRVAPVSRIFPQASVGRAIATTSIDEGVETDYDEENDGSKETAGQIPVLSAVAGAEGAGCLAKADAYGCFGRIGLPNQPLIIPNASFDSNIELDVISNVSSSPSGSITSSAVPTDVADVPECPGDVPEEESTDDQRNSGLCVDFREGRRASDGLMVRGVLEFQQHLKKSMKTHGMAELRKELEKLQLETSGDGDAKYRAARPGRFADVRSIQQRSMEESVSTVRGPSLMIKRTNLTSVDHYGPLVLQKRLTMKLGLQAGICYEPVHSAAFAPDPDAVRGPAGVSPHVSNLRTIKSQPLQMMPYCTSPNRQLWLLQASLKQPHQQVQAKEVEDASVARFGLLHSRFPQRNDDPSSVSVKPAALPLSLRSLSPSFLHGDLPPFHAQLSAEPFPVASSHQPKTVHLVPTCRSQGNLTEYGLGVDSSQTRDSASLGALLKHPAYCGGGAAVATVAAAEVQEPDAKKRHMVRRTLFRLVQQETLVSPCDEDELNLGDSVGSSANDSTIASTLMDLS